MLEGVEKDSIMARNSEKTASQRGPGRPFTPGQSGNPGGRPREAVHVRELARTRTTEAIDTLAEIMLHGKKEAARVRAAEALLARGWGQSTQPVEMRQQINLDVVNTMSLEELRVLESALEKLTRGNSASNAAGSLPEGPTKPH